MQVKTVKHIQESAPSEHHELVGGVLAASHLLKAVGTFLLKWSR